MEDLRLVITLRGRHFSKHEAACNAERPLFECGARIPLAQCSRMLARRVCFCVEARTRSRHLSPRAISLDKPRFFLLDSDGKFSQVQSSNLLLPARFGLPPTARSLFMRHRVDENNRASLIQAVMRMRQVQSNGSIATTVDRVPRSSVHTWVHEDMCLLLSAWWRFCK